MSWLDDLMSGVSDAFGGVSDSLSSMGSGLTSMFGGGSTPSFGSGFDFNLGDTSGAFSGATGAAGGGAGSLFGGANFDFSGAGSGAGSVLGDFSNLGNADLSNFSWSNFNPTAALGGIDWSNPSLFSVPGGIVSPFTSGGGTPSAGGGSPGQVPRTPAMGGGTRTPAPAGGAGQPGGVPGVPAAGGGGLGGVLGSVLGNNTNLMSLLGLVPGVMSMIGSKDQTNLGPDADKLRAMADTNRNTEAALQQEAQAEKMGQLPGPAMAQLAASTAEQKAAMRSRYASMGMSGSSAEGADMAAINQQTEGQRFNIGMGMANEALGQVSGLQTQDVGIYQNLMDQQTQRDKEYMDAMAKMWDGLGKAFAGGTQVTNNIGQPGGISAPVTPSALTPVDVMTNPNVVSAVDPATMIPNLNTLIPSPVGGLTIPGVTDPNQSAPLGNVDFSNLGGADLTNFDWSKFDPSALTFTLGQ